MPTVGQPGFYSRGLNRYELSAFTFTTVGQIRQVSVNNPPSVSASAIVHIFGGTVTGTLVLPCLNTITTHNQANNAGGTATGTYYIIRNAATVNLTVSACTSPTVVGVLPTTIENNSNYVLPPGQSIQIFL